eukprot:362663-Chlamydomonas_euryale.AAC.1
MRDKLQQLPPQHLVLLPVRTPPSPPHTSTPLTPGARQTPAAATAAPLAPRSQARSRGCRCGRPACAPDSPGVDLHVGTPSPAAAPGRR